MTDLIKQIRDYRLVITVWNHYDKRLDIVRSTNKTKKDGSSQSEEHEITFQAGRDGIMAAISLMEVLLEQLKDIKDKIPR